MGKTSKTVPAGTVGAALAPAMLTLRCPRVTYGFGMYEDAGDVREVRCAPGAAPGADRLVELFGDGIISAATWDLSEINEGSTGEVYVDFAGRCVTARVYHCNYSETLSGDWDWDPQTDKATDTRIYADPPEGCLRPTYASEEYRRDRYYDPAQTIHDPADPLLTFVPDFGPEVYAPHHVAGVEGLVAGADSGTVADYLEDTDARPGPAYPALAAALRAAVEEPASAVVLPADRFWTRGKEARDAAFRLCYLGPGAFVCAVLGGAWYADGPMEEVARAHLLFGADGALRCFRSEPGREALELLDRELEGRDVWGALR